MRTIKALRTAITTNDHRLKIGQLELKHESGNDIDIYMKDTLIGWIAASTADDTKLEDVDMTVADGVFKSKKESERMSELEKESESKDNTLTQLRATIGELEAELEVAKSKPAIKDGMIFAYEKVLKINHDQPLDIDWKGNNEPADSGSDSTE